MKTRAALFITLAALTIMTIFVSACATSIPLKEGDYSLLKGQWLGKIERRGPDGTLWWESQQFRVNVDSPRIRDGKLVLEVHGVTREFLLKRGKNDELSLETSYPTTWEGWPRIDTIILKKLPTS